MKFEAAAMIPGFANMFQKGTEPSAKSSQSGARDGSTQFACNWRAGACADPTRPSAATAARTPSLFTGNRVARWAAAVAFGL
jgi:hypothetical protein